MRIYTQVDSKVGRGFEPIWVYLLSIFWLPFTLSAFTVLEELTHEQKIVIAEKKIELEDCVDATNPSLLKLDRGYLLSFRYMPDRYNDPYVSYIGLVLLNDSLDPISYPQLLDTRFKNSKTVSQSEDARLFSYQGRIFLTYNDNMDFNCTSHLDRRDIFLVEVFQKHKKFTISEPLKLQHPDKSQVIVQKNWVPFEWNQKLLIGYTVNPHEILYVNLQSGICYPCYETKVPIDWEFGTLRGSTPPQIVDGEYLAFFLSVIYTSSLSSWGWNSWHYFMGAYTFSSSPPFEITSYTPLPIAGEGFYTQSNREKRVIFPGGFAVTDSAIYIAYGKDDYEIWIATIDKNELKKALQPICKE